jgi:hypothetical protein
LSTFRVFSVLKLSVNTFSGSPSMHIVYITSNSSKVSLIYFHSLSSLSDFIKHCMLWIGYSLIGNNALNFTSAN